MTNIAKGALVILNAHTATPEVYWNGALLTQVTDIKVINHVVTLTIPEDPVLVAMKAAGIIIKRV